MSKQINELKIKRVNLVEKLEDIHAKSENNYDEKAQRSFERGRIELEMLDEELSQLERQETLNKNKMTMSVNTTNNDFETWLRSSLNASPGTAPGSFTIQYRANPLITTSDTNFLNKVVGPVDVLYSPAEQLLRTLGVKFYTGLNGAFVMPVFDQVTAGWISEAADSSSANIAPTSNTMNPVRVSCSQILSKEFLVNTNADVLANVQNVLYNSIFNAIEEKFYDKLESTTAGQVYTKASAGGSVAMVDFTGMEASLGAYQLNSKIVMQPQTKGYLKSTSWTTNQLPLWYEDKVNGIPAYSTPAANNEKVYMGDFSHSAIGLWGNGIEIIVDPFTKAAAGELVLTVVAFADTAVYNKKAFVTLVDASTY